VLAVALRLGLTSFGGPIAHIGYFRTEYVERRRWLDDAAFSELVALTNLLPGPSSSQLGIAVGALRAGRLGGLAAWVGFTVPSALAMTALGIWLTTSDLAGAGWVKGLELVAVPVVLLAVLGMRRTLAPDVGRLAMAVGAAALVLATGTALGQVAAIAAGGAVGALTLRRRVLPAAATIRSPVGRVAGAVALALFAVLLVLLPALRDATESQGLALFDAMYRAGALVFGGGHVVLPLLYESVVEPGWVGEEEFLAGYGAVQAMPGPLFTFSAFVGAAEGPEPNGAPGAAIALVGIFLPSFLALAGVLPFWGWVRRFRAAQAVIAGIGAAVVGILAAAFVDPVLSTAVDGVGDAVFASALLVTLRVLPVWATVLVAAAAGALVY
jgi:chromate transporter